MLRFASFIQKTERGLESLPAFRNFFLKITGILKKAVVALTLKAKEIYLNVKVLADLFYLEIKLIKESSQFLFQYFFPLIKSTYMNDIFDI